MLVTWPCCGAADCSTPACSPHPMWHLKVCCHLMETLEGTENMGCESIVPSSAHGCQCWAVFTPACTSKRSEDQPSARCSQWQVAAQAGRSAAWPLLSSAAPASQVQQGQAGLKEWEEFRVS